MTTDQKRALAELAIRAGWVRLGVAVYRPIAEGGRYDLIFEVADRLWRVQCKWAPIYRQTVIIRCYSSRRNRAGLLKRTYKPSEVDAFAGYCPISTAATSCPMRIRPEDPDRTEADADAEQPIARRELGL